MKPTKQIFEINPYKGIGPFKLKTNINNYNNYNLTLHKSDDSTGWDVYKLGNSISIYTDNEVIVSIACRVSCTLNGVTIVGGHFSDFLSAFQPSNVTHDKIYMPEDDDYQDVCDVDDFGIQLWVRKDIIVTVFCSSQ